MTPLESKALLTVLGDDAEDTARFMVRRSSGSWESRRLQLLDSAPEVIAYYSEGSAALAVDLYEDARAEAAAAGRFAASPVVLDRTVKIRRGIAWASEPLSVDDDELAAKRLAKLTRTEIMRPYRDTILDNRKRDPQAAGWVRIASPSACGFCRMLAAKGAIYRHDTAMFAAHDNCSCTAAPVFKGGEQGPEASALQYVASGRRRTAKEKAALRDAIAYYEDTR